MRPIVMVTASLFTAGFNALEVAHAKDIPAARSSVVTAVLDYSKDRQEAADAFFKALGRHAGKSISLVLEIVPKQDAGAPGYKLTKDTASGQNVLCGTSNYGVVDNYQSSYRLTFQHPAHFHAPTEIVIGDRSRYPFHGIRCGVENYTTKELTHLHVRGHFVVVEAEIPTANSYTLYPYAP